MSALAVVAAIATLAASAAPEAKPDLEAYRNRARVLVVCADRPDDPALRRQQALVTAAGAGMDERDLVTVSVIADRAEVPDGAHLSAERLRRATGFAAHSGFGVALIGKDGGVKLVRRAPITPEALFAVIDAMPMRRDEMRR